MMNSSEKKWKPDVDKAWQTFYARARAEAIVPAETIKGRTIPVYVKWNVAAVLCALCIGLTAMLWPYLFSAGMVVQNTQDHEVLITTLPDGSVVFLEGGGKLTCPRSFASGRRRVTLEGGAFFDVSRDKQRPFIVETEKIDVEVLGTSFRIQSGPEHPFELVVRSGVVKVVLKNEAQEVLAGAGEQVQWADSRLQKSHVEDAGILGSDVRRLYFKDESLGQIIRVVNECISQTMRLALDDESLSDRIITVTLEYESVERIAEIICGALDLEQTVRESVIYIRKK